MGYIALVSGGYVEVAVVTITVSMVLLELSPTARGKFSSF